MLREIFSGGVIASGAHVVHSTFVRVGAVSAMTWQTFAAWLLAAVVAPALAAMESPLGLWARELVEGVPVPPMPPPQALAAAAAAVAIGGGVWFRIKHGEVSAGVHPSLLPNPFSMRIRLRWCFNTCGLISFIPALPLLECGAERDATQPQGCRAERPASCRGAPRQPFLLPFIVACEQL